MKVKAKFFAMILLGLSGCSIGTQDIRAATLEVIRSIDVPWGTYSGTDLAWDGQHLRAVVLGSGWDDFGWVYEIDPFNGSIVSSYRSALLNPRGLTFDGTYLWHTSIRSSGWYGDPPQRLPYAIEKRSTDGTLSGSFPEPFGPRFLAGAAWDGANLWIADNSQSEILKVDPADLQVTASLSAPAGSLGGMTWDGSSLWAVDGADDLIYRIDTSGEVTGTWSTPGSNPWGITFDGEYLWILDNTTRKMYQLAIPEPSTMTLLGLTAGCLAAGYVLCVLKKRHFETGGLEDVDQ